MPKGNKGKGKGKEEDFSKGKGKGKGKGKDFSKGKYHNTVLCKYDQSGTCMFGDKCCYAHGEHQLMEKQNAKIGQQLLSRN